MNEVEAIDIAETKIDDIERMLLYDGRLVSQFIARTNAAFFTVDECIVRSARFDESTGCISFSVYVHMEGEHDDSKPFLGDDLDIELAAELKCDSSGWVVNRYSIESCLLGK